MLLIESASSTRGLISEPAKVTQSCQSGESWRKSVIEAKEPEIPSVAPPSDRQQDRGKQPGRAAAWPALPAFLLHKIEVLLLDLCKST